MKKLIAVLSMSWLAFGLNAGELKWLTDYEAAKAQAKKESKLVLIDFTGSDWCGFCIKLNKEVFSQPEFGNYAKDNLVLLEVDFPKKKKLSAEQQKANEKLQQQYGVQGFPTIVVLNNEGKEVWKQVGNSLGGPQAWIAKLDEAKKK